MGNASTPPASGEPPAKARDALVSVYGAKRFGEARVMARKLAAQFPESGLVANVLGASARALGDLGEAEEAFRKAAMLAPASADTHFNLALVLQQVGKPTGALEAYRRVIALDPDHVQARNNLGIALTRAGEVEEALAHLGHALACAPANAHLHHSYGNALRRARRLKDALAAYGKAIELRPDFARSHYNSALTHRERGDNDASLASLERVLELQPDHSLARQQWFYILLQRCDWDALAKERDAIDDLGVVGEGVPPFPLLAIGDDPARQLARSRNWAKRLFKLPLQPLPARPKERPEKLKLAIYSGDFHNHPSMHLMAGLLAHIDREKFELHAFSYGQQADDDYRQKARERVTHFHDVSGWSDARILELTRKVAPHIAIDRKGYTAGSRGELFEHRLAPVQVNYLAYPGSLGVDCIDYMVTDAVTVPGHLREYISEKLIELPHCYQPADDERTIAPLTTSRADHGLPEDAFVFTCFNANYKISPREFDIWMRILAQVEGSVLWLFRSNPVAEVNLRKAAEARGIDPARLVFASRVPSPEHLARHAHADLMIDTFAVNAHTTTNDALWAGVPVVTRIGEQFAARVAASLLKAVGLEELVTTTDADYEALICDLARDPDRMAQLRAKLAANRSAHLSAKPLFNTALYTRHFEAGLAEAYDRFYRGEPPADIIVPDLSD